MPYIWHREMSLCCYYFRYSGIRNSVVGWEIPWHFQWMWITTHLTTWENLNPHPNYDTPLYDKMPNETRQSNATKTMHSNLSSEFRFISFQTSIQNRISMSWSRKDTKYNSCNWQKLFFKNCQFHHWNTLWNTTRWK